MQTAPSSMQKATRSDSFVEATILEQGRDHFLQASQSLNDSCASRDLVCSPWACLLWCLPTAMLVGGSRLALDSCALSCRDRLHRECGPLRSVALLHHGDVFQGSIATRAFPAGCLRGECCGLSHGISSRQVRKRSGNKALQDTGILEALGELNGSRCPSQLDYHSHLQLRGDSLTCNLLGVGA